MGQVSKILPKRKKNSFTHHGTISPQTHPSISQEPSLISCSNCAMPGVRSPYRCTALEEQMQSYPWVIPTRVGLSPPSPSPPVAVGTGTSITCRLPTHSTVSLLMGCAERALAAPRTRPTDCLGFLKIRIRLI